MADTTDIGGNAREISGHLDDIAKRQDEVKALKAEAKADGFDMKALGQILREHRGARNIRRRSSSWSWCSIPTARRSTCRPTWKRRRSSPPPQPRRCRTSRKPTTTTMIGHAERGRRGRI